MNSRIQVIFRDKQRVLADPDELYRRFIGTFKRIVRIRTTITTVTISSTSKTIQITTYKTSFSHHQSHTHK